MKQYHCMSKGHISVPWETPSTRAPLTLHCTTNAGWGLVLSYDLFSWLQCVPVHRSIFIFNKLENLLKLFLKK